MMAFRIRSFEWVKDSIGICYLVECCWSFRAVAPARTGMFGIPLKLLNFTSDLVDVREQPARRFTIETRSRNERIMPLLPLWPRPRIQLGPIIPPLLRRERRKMTPTRPWIESFLFGHSVPFCGLLLTQVALIDRPGRRRFRRASGRRAPVGRLRRRVVRLICRGRPATVAVRRVWRA